MTILLRWLKKTNLMTFTIGKKKKIQWKYIVLDFDFTKLNER